MRAWREYLTPVTELVAGLDKQDCRVIYNMLRYIPDHYEVNCQIHSTDKDLEVKQRERSCKDGGGDKALSWVLRDKGEIVIYSMSGILCFSFYFPVRK